MARKCPARTVVIATGTQYRKRGSGSLHAAQRRKQSTFHRRHLGLSQEGLVRQFGLWAKLTRNDISKYERGVREPSLSTLLKYARAGEVSVEVLIDDGLDISMGGVAGRRRADLSCEKAHRMIDINI